jgi:hypothetical protein
VLTVFAGAVVVYGSTRMRFAAEVPIVILAAVALAGLSRRMWPGGRRTPDVPDGRRGLAAADLGATDGWVEAEGEPIGPSWGLALRIRDERNYTWVQFAPAFARIRIGVTEGGVDTEIGQLPLRAATAFARVRVEFVGEELSVWIDDRLSGTVRVPRPAGGTAVGLVGGANAIGTSTWRDLRAGPTTGTAATPGGSP